MKKSSNVKKQYIQAQAKMENLAMEILHTANCIKIYRDSAEDDWPSVGTVNSINEKLEAVLNEIKAYEKIRCAGPKVFYTGGGIWLSAKYIDDTHYFIVDNDCDDCLTYYDHTNEDEDSEFPCQNMIYSWSLDEIPEEYKEIYKELHAALMQKMF